MTQLLMDGKLVELKIINNNRDYSTVWKRSGRIIKSGLSICPAEVSAPIATFVSIRRAICLEQNILQQAARPWMFQVPDDAPLAALTATVTYNNNSKKYGEYGESPVLRTVRSVVPLYGGMVMRIL
ncbi:hypothetical protein BDBG_03488 [Blastomyces gilchristii SLH14081]|uniref:Uncharacterized protein n=1 Tax=Blastomyces gilchristii (strain SLH14081) TaxID=559298 RepID=A0A179UHV0_BLAGS|nr:uncharacterized protein BDBG_03488 [Blastomyces gilchristii SLH14081]OAT07430.1 hypothetical protein BDBG_03488 [Blastomyces gilchristii SLH14081]